eukprot:gene12420-biopygen1779
MQIKMLTTILCLTLFATAPVAFITKVLGRGEERIVQHMNAGAENAFAAYNSLLVPEIYKMAILPMGVESQIASYDARQTCPWLWTMKLNHDAIAETACHTGSSAIYCWGKYLLSLTSFQPAVAWVLETIPPVSCPDPADPEDSAHVLHNHIIIFIVLLGLLCAGGAAEPIVFVLPHLPATRPPAGSHNSGDDDDDSNSSNNSSNNSSSNSSSNNNNNNNNN